MERRNSSSRSWSSISLMLFVLLAAGIGAGQTFAGLPTDQRAAGTSGSAGGTTTPQATPTCAPTGAPYNIAVVNSDDEPPGQLIAQIQADPDVASVFPLDARFSTPTLAQLLLYDLVVVYSNIQYHDPVALGNVIADYQDAGGIVVATNANWFGPPYGMEGRWMTGGYTMFTYPAPPNNSTSTLGTHDPTHPLMQGVDELFAFFRYQVTLTAGSTQVAAWADGLPLVAYKTTNGHTAVGINALLSLPEEGWGGDFGTLIVNAARWLQPGVPCVTPTASTTATVPATPTAPQATATSAVTSTPNGTSTPISTATPCSIQFGDVPQSDPFYAHIHCLACRGVISGYADGTFRPYNFITRGQISKVVSNAAGFTEPVSGQSYTDVLPTDTFYEWIERLTTRQVMSGYGCGGPGEPCDPANRPYFRPGANATRGQLSKIVSNAAQYNEPVTGQFYADVDSTNPFYNEIMRLTNRGVMSGYPCGGVGEPCDPANRPYFRWGNNVTRGQASKIVANTFFPGCESP